MKRITLLLAIFLLTAILGCVFVSRNLSEHTFEGISLGIDREEVTRIAGRPAEIKNRVIEGQEYEIWSYPIKELLARKYNTLPASYYEIFFLDGKVTQWYKTKVYAQPEYELQQPLTPEGKVRTFKFFEKK